MNDEMNASPEPSQQPVSVHDASTTHHSGWPLVAGMLGVFLVLETVVLGYVVTTYVGVKDAKQATQERRQELVEKLKDKASNLQSAAGAPFIYSVASDNGSGSFGQEIRMVDAQTGKETTVYQASESSYVQLVAVPEVGYDGRIFFTMVGEGDNPYWALQSLDIDTDQEPTPVSLPSFSTVQRWNSAISPDETMIVGFTYDAENDEVARSLKVWNLLTGEMEEMGVLAEGEYFYSGPGFGGVEGSDIYWSDRECVVATVYEDAADPNSPNTFKEHRTLCLE